MDRYKKIERRVTRFLQDRDLMDSVDSTLVEELIYNVKLCDKAKEDIDDRGINVNIRKDKDETPYYQVNQSIATYYNSVKLIINLYVKLGLTVQERKSIGEIVDNSKNELSELLNN